MLLWLLVINVVCVAGIGVKKPPATPPHIVVVIADDLGWADTSLHGSAQIPTPNLDALASMGVLLNDYYVQPLCSPSRAALMTGLYPAHNGVRAPIMAAQVGGLPLQFKILPEHLKDLGYETHAVGKWHLGYSSFNYTPTYRGFDSFYGFHNGPNDYYHGILENEGRRGLDFWNGTHPLPLEQRIYSTTLFKDRAKSIITNRNTSKPLFLYLAHQAAHSAYEPELLQAPEENVKKFRYIGDRNRTLLAGMVDALDQSVGALIEELEKANMLENTVLVFSTDNGGHPYTRDDPNRGFNWPLRGIKGTVWEGGIRGTAFVWSPRLKVTRRVSNQLMHITDWLPTLYSAAGGDVQNLGSLDGTDMWHALSTGAPSPRTEALLEFNTETEIAALRYLNYKIVLGNYSEEVSERYKVIGRAHPNNDLDSLQRNSRAAGVLKRLYGKPQLFQRGYDKSWRRRAAVTCNEGPTNFDTGILIFVFDLESDPCELRNMAARNPLLLNNLLAKLGGYMSTLHPEIDKTIDPKGYPENNNGNWAPWIF
ncbi:hypothetical protein V5799_002336 [Amblyomma americanum]|uniref:Sulfatase N-terminal domain-containing protein n=1 Tax=Amblyomma americanum TaxID=6943 RepID=A0AAQ4CXM5_AMBAM